MAIVTLTTDFGLKDYYAAVIKGAILCEDATANIIDISHHVNNYDIVQGAFILKNAYHSFPKGTIHIISINNFYSPERTFIALRYDGHYFIGPDNGIFSLMFPEIPDDVYELEFIERGNFPLKDVFAKAVGHISSEKPFNEIGIPVEKIVERITLQAVISPSQIRGSVIHIDKYENVILNINKALFEKIRKKRSFALYFKRHEPIKKLSKYYYEVPIGETLCLFNSANYLEIAINMGKASSLLGLNIDDTVQIDFFHKER